MTISMGAALTVMLCHRKTNITYKGADNFYTMRESNSHLSDLSPSHTGLATMLRHTYDHKIRRIADHEIDLRNRGWSYEQIWSQQGRCSCSKLRTCDYKSQEVANRSYNTVRPVVQGWTINRAWSWVDKSRDWSGDWLADHEIGRAICGTVSRLVVRSITTSDDWLHDLILVVQLVVICWWFHIKGTRF